MPLGEPWLNRRGEPLPLYPSQPTFAARISRTMPLADVTGNPRAATKSLRFITEVRMAAYRGSCICGEVPGLSIPAR